jgi:hypothetical protein
MCRGKARNLCRGHHREVHRCGDEAAWWNKTGIDPTAAARALWLKTHPLPKILSSSILIAHAPDRFTPRDGGVVTLRRFQVRIVHLILNRCRPAISAMLTKVR